MTLRVLNVASETVATSTAGIRSAAIPCLPLDTAEMILSTAWIPLAPVPGRHLRQMLSSGEAAMVGWILKKLHVLELNINKSHLSPARGFALGRQTPYPPCWKLVTLNQQRKGLLMLLFMVLRILVAFASSLFQHCLSEHAFYCKICYLILPMVSVNQNAVQIISS